MGSDRNGQNSVDTFMRISLERRVATATCENDRTTLLVINRRKNKMNTRWLLAIVFAMALSAAPQPAATFVIAEAPAT